MLKRSIVASTLVVASFGFLSTAATAQGWDRHDRDRINAEYREHMRHCGHMRGHDRRACVAQATAERDREMAHHRG